jgi:hypothetical protein
VAALLIQHHNKGKAIPVRKYYRSRGFQEAESPRFRDSRYIKMIKSSALRNGRLYPPGNIQHPDDIIVINSNNNIVIVNKLSYGYRGEM